MQRWDGEMTGADDPQEAPPDASGGSERPLARSRDEIRPFLQLCREGRLYEVERWLAEGRPAQLDPDAIRKGYRPPSSLEVAIETGQHSLTLLLLRHGFRLDLESHNPLDRALKRRRWDLFDLLLEWRADLTSADVYAVLETYNVGLYERYLAAGYDLTQSHAMGDILGHGTSNRPLLGFAKRHRAEDPRIQMELNIALCCHAREGNDRGISLCLWAGADPHAPAPNIELGLPSEPDPDDEEPFLGWSAIFEAMQNDNLEALKRLGPDPARDDFDDLYTWVKSGAMVKFLASIQPPKDLTSILEWQLRMLAHPWPGSSDRTWVVEELLSCGVCWEEKDPEKLGDIRRSLLKLRDGNLQDLMKVLKKPAVCTVDTYLELIHTPSMRKRLVALGLLKPVAREPRPRNRPPSGQPPVTTRATVPVPLLSRVYADSHRFDRSKLYEEVWSKPVQQVAKAYGLSGRGLAKACHRLLVPVPPRGYWARIRNGSTVKKPPLPKVREPGSHDPGRSEQ